MVLALPINNPEYMDVRRIGNAIQELNLLATCGSSISIEPSLVVDTECFEEYRKTRMLPCRVAETCLENLQKLNIIRVDIYPSVFRDCVMDDYPITATVSLASIRNAMLSIYERWYDDKPMAKRIIRHLEASDTYPAILIQPHREEEYTIITRNPKTGELLKSGDDVSYIVHCTGALLTENEGKMIEAADRNLDLPRKIVYVKNPDGSCAIRRTIDYPMTAEAKVKYILNQFDEGRFSRLKAISLIQPENIVIINGYCYMLSAKTQHRGMTAEPGRIAVGKAVFPWSDASSITENSIFITLDVSYNEVDILKKCTGVITVYGGQTSHAAVISLGLHKACITGSSDLIFCGENQVVQTSAGEVIREGDIICIADDRWSVGGDIIQNNNYKAVCSKQTIKKVYALLQPYLSPDILAMVPLEGQMHIAELMAAFRKSGWIN